MKSQSKLVYRQEHPNPQFRREDYRCLNGEWEFAFGKGEEACFPERIIVPFCPESALSGIGRTDMFTDCVYARDIEVTKEDINGRLELHFGGVDYYARVFINGRFVGEHRGGYTAFAVDIAPYCTEGKNRLTLFVHDDVRENVASGKQTAKEYSFGCFYTRVTGIWQTVWLERTPKAHVKEIKFYPDVENCKVTCEVITEGRAHTHISVTYEGREVGVADGDGYYRQRFSIDLSEKHLWALGEGRLYDVEISFGEDKVYSYFGLRSVKYEGMKFLLNGKSVFQRLVLDQGYYKGGIYTAPTVETFTEDIQRSLRLGFNGARLHQKVFEQRFLYECDRLGYMVWGEYPNWGVGCENIDGLSAFVGEWKETVEQYFNHPSIITWCPLNENWENLEDLGKIRDIRFVETLYATTKLLDPTRPCVDVSGGFHGRFTDIADFHCYDGFERLKVRMDKTLQGVYEFDKMYVEEEGIVYGGEPINLSEFGGIAFCGETVDRCNSIGETQAWGYTAVGGETQFVENYVKTMELLLSYKQLSGLCYTQLYDVEQEQNGFYFYNRENKLSVESMRRIAQVNKKVAAIEEK